MLEPQGYTNVEKRGFFRWKATAPEGHEVKGVVCMGFFKGATL